MHEHGGVMEIHTGRDWWVNMVGALYVGSIYAAIALSVAAGVRHWL